MTAICYDYDYYFYFVITINIFHWGQNINWEIILLLTFRMYLLFQSF